MKQTYCTAIIAAMEESTTLTQADKTKNEVAQQEDILPIWEMRTNNFMEVTLRNRSKFFDRKKV